MKAGIAMADRSFECVLCQRTFSRFTPDALLLSTNLVCDDCLKELHLMEEGDLGKQISERLARNPSHHSPELKKAVTRLIQQYAGGMKGA